MPLPKSLRACSPDVYQLVTPLDHRVNLSSRTGETRKRKSLEHTAGQTVPHGASLKGSGREISAENRA